MPRGTVLITVVRETYSLDRVLTRTYRLTSRDPASMKSMSNLDTPQFVHLGCCSTPSFHDVKHGIQLLYDDDPMGER